MKKFLTLLILPLMLVSFVPIPASAETNGGVGPSSFFYFFDTTFENINLFFTFDSEKKAQKALGYAEERLSEAKESANDNKPKAVEKAMDDYEKKISLATEKSKELKDKKKAEELLNTVSESTAKHQEILEATLDKVPDEAKEAILKAIEVSKRGQEQALREMATLREEVVELKDEIQELKEELENKEEEPKANDTDEKIEQLKKEIEELKQEVKQPELEEAKIQDTKNELKIITLPNGAIVEMDENGNITKTIKEAPKQAEATTPDPITNTEPQTVSLEIMSVSISSTWSLMTFEWTTNTPSNSKIFISGGGFSAKVYSSESGLSTRHIANISGLSGNTNYTYEIESISEENVVKKQGSYSTKQVNENASLKITSSCRKIFPGTYCDVEVSYFESGQRKNISAISVSANDAGLFIESSYPGVICIGALSANSDGSQRKGNPLTCGTRPSPRDGKPIALFTYLPSASGTRTITATSNGATATIETQGQISECDGVVRGEGVCQL